MNWWNIKKVDMAFSDPLAVTIQRKLYCIDPIIWQGDEFSFIHCIFICENGGVASQYKRGQSNGIGTDRIILPNRMPNGD